MQLTRTPAGAASSARTLVSITTAAFDTEYAPIDRSPTTPASAAPPPPPPPTPPPPPPPLRPPQPPALCAPDPAPAQQKRAVAVRRHRLRPVLRRRIQQRIDDAPPGAGDQQRDRSEARLGDVERVLGRLAATGVGGDELDLP